MHWNGCVVLVAVVGVAAALLLDGFFTVGSVLHRGR
jgi:hypothetical protein